MGRLRTSLKWGFLSTLVMLIVLIAAWAVSRAVYPTGAQREAIAEMQQYPDYTGENAFALLWTLERDVPDDELEAVMAEDVRRLSNKPSARAPDSEQAWGFESAAQAYPDLSPTAEDRNLFCDSRAEHCLARVREDIEAYAALIDRNRKLLDRIERLEDHEYVRFEFPYGMTAPIPSFQTTFLLRTRRAVDFAQGRTREALAGTCRDIAAWRRLGAHSDNMITRLIGAAHVTVHNGRMFANMLAELPVDRPLPEPCDEALAPPGIDDLSICNAMRGEFAMGSDAMKDIPESIDQDAYLDRLAWALLYDAEATVGMSAQGLQATCSQSERERLLADRRQLPESPQQGMWRFSCIGNPIGCMINSIAIPSYAGYRLRLQDYGARLRVLGTLAWMRRHAGDGRSPTELLAARPDDLKSPARDIAFGPEGRTLRVPLYEDRRNEYWSLPLPPALHAVPAE